MSAPIRIGIVGTGGIARVHADNIAKLGDQAVIVGAVDVDPERLAGFQAEFGVEAGYGSLEELLAQGKPDIVHLCTPPGLHKEQALVALAAGVDVLSEKPPALSLAEIDELVAAEQASGAHFATVSQHRFGGRAKWLRERLADGRLGRPFVAVCNTLWYRPDSYFDVPWRGNWAIEGGGPTMGHGIHQLDTLLSILGPWSEVVAVSARQARPVATEDLSTAIVTFENGAVATVVNSLLSPRETSYLRFDFEFATVELEHLYGYGDDNWKITPAPGHEEEVEALWAEGPHGNSGHAAQFREVIVAREQGLPLPVETASARRTLELIAGIYASSFTGARVATGDIDADSPFYTSMEGSGAPWREALVAAE
ncbi:Gfo/Idh/MocA family protein [Gryllotalpicola protaetiae]|uniref:Gfo/Idh/MocA family oxidoreductase n=1 Tax=Gryllotalpicola protaetiae TaxID=2419771 RepID=A0A387BSL8_9MICO|nr:Gfo/Idh/MocA family oxidoreductase [Gryllotalpicola protaetiae]AYG04059.1 gfo/Idh/MocA family oxidoreductase [Gryllotalpicola protaetiae]